MQPRFEARSNHGACASFCMNGIAPAALYRAPMQARRGFRSDAPRALSNRKTGSIATPSHQIDVRRCHVDLCFFCSRIEPISLDHIWHPPPEYLTDQIDRLPASVQNRPVPSRDRHPARSNTSASMSQPSFLTVEGELARPSLLPLLGLPFGREWTIGKSASPCPLGYCATLWTYCIDVMAPHPSCRWGATTCESADPIDAAIAHIPSSRGRSPIRLTPKRREATASLGSITSRISLIKLMPRPRYRPIAVSAVAGMAIVLACLMIGSPYRRTQPPEAVTADTISPAQAAPATTTTSNHAAKPRQPASPTVIAQVPRATNPNHVARSDRRKNAVTKMSRREENKTRTYKASAMKPSSPDTTRRHAKPQRASIKPRIATAEEAAILEASPINALPLEPRAAAPLPQIDWMPLMKHRRLTEDKRFSR